MSRRSVNYTVQTASQFVFQWAPLRKGCSAWWHHAKKLQTCGRRKTNLHRTRHKWCQSCQEMTLNCVCTQQNQMNKQSKTNITHPLCRVCMQTHGHSKLASRANQNECRPIGSHTLMQNSHDCINRIELRSRIKQPVEV